MHLRTITRADFPEVLALNEAAEPFVSAMDEKALDWLVRHSARAVVVDVTDEAGGAGASTSTVAAFTIVLEPGTSYWSGNYAWFAERYRDFRYLDRIAVGEAWRRRGIGTLVYDAMEADAGPHGRLLCEVDLDPPNGPSLSFHAARGYVEVGQRRDDSGKLLSMLAKQCRPPATTDA